MSPARRIRSTPSTAARPIRRQRRIAAGLRDRHPGHDHRLADRDGSKAYDGTTAATSPPATITSRVSGNDVVTLNDATSGTYDTKDAGSGKAVSVTGLSLSGAAASNYTLAGTTVSGTGGPDHRPTRSSSRTS